MTQRTETSYSTSPKDLPKAFWWGLGMGLAAFVIKFTSGTTTKVNGVVTQCSYTDYFALFAAVFCVVAAVLGLRQGPRAGRARRVHPAVLVGVAVVVLALAGVHVLRGLGMLGGPC